MSAFRVWLINKFKFVRSLRVWVFFIVFTMGLIPCLVLSNVLLENYERKAVNVRISDVSNQLNIISDHLLTYGYLQGVGSEVIDAELAQLSNLYDGRILIINSDLCVIKDTYGLSQGKTIISEEVVKAILGETISQYDNETGYIEIATPISETVKSDFAEYDNSDENQNNSSRTVGVMLTSVSAATILNTQNTLRRTSDIVVMIAILVLLGVSLGVSFLLLKPFKELTSQISDIKAGYTKDPVNVRDYLETESISDAFNQVFGRMKLLDDSRQEFVANVSHELKTPMTSVKVLADSLLSQQDVPAELYREFMEDITKEIDRENKIISDLLSLVKMDKTASEMNVSQVDINELAELVLKRLRPIARKMDVELTLESHNAVSATVDEVKISQIITNLVENAIKYNKEHGWVKVILEADHQFFTITVQDSGIGMPPEAMDHIYERFYRVDKSHSREIGGTGLGLAITRTAVLMHRGSISVESVEDEGTTFTVKIPLTYIAG